MAKKLNTKPEETNEAPKAEKKAKKVPAKTPAGMVTVKELEAEFGIAATSIRQIIRATGLRAPKAETEPGTFGPRTKYQWPEGSEELAKIKEAIQAAIDAEDNENSEEDGGEEE